MNIQKLIPPLKRSLAAAASRFQPIFRPVTWLAFNAWQMCFPPDDFDGTKSSNGFTLDKGVFAVTILCSLWVGLMMVKVLLPGNAVLDQPVPPYYLLNDTPEPTTSPIGGNLEELLLSELSAQPVAISGTMVLRKEILEYLELLEVATDTEQSTRHFVDKYDNLSMAASLLSYLSNSPGKQRLWSSIAINHAEQAMNRLPLAEGTRDRFQALLLHKLVAMTLNYYQRGTVSAEQLQQCFRQLNKSWLVHSGFCQVKLLQALADDGIIALPAYQRLKTS